MNEKASDDPADRLYAEGMKHDWRQDQSLAAATLARATFHQAAILGHSKAIRALAHMTFEGRGGGQDRQQALLLLWSAFLRGDHDSLEELADMLESYAEAEEQADTGKDAVQASRHTHELIDRLSRVRNFMQALRHEHSTGKQMK